MGLLNKISSVTIQNNFFAKIIESLIGKGSSMIFGLLFSYICSRLYGAENFGEYTYAFTIVSILMVVAKAGMDNGLMYSIPKNKYKHVSLSFIVNFAISLILITTVWFFIDDIYIKFLLPLVWFTSASQIFFGIYRSDGKIKEYYFINGFLAMLLRVGLVLALYFLTGKNEYSIAIAVYISFLFSNLVYLFQNKAKYGRIIFDRAFLMYSFPLIISTMLSTLINKTDIIMLGSMTSNSDVGIYQITVQVSSVVSVLLLVFNTVFAPEIAKLYHQGKSLRLKKLYIKATRILAVLSLLTTLILLFSSEVLLLIFGSEFVDGQTSLILRSIGQFINIAVGGVWLMLSMTGKPRIQMYSNILAFGINILLNLVFIPTHGIDGAAFASMITIVFINVVGYVVVSKQFDVKVFKYF